MPKVHVDEGDEVKKGMILIEIDQADYLTQLAQPKLPTKLCRQSSWKHNATLICPTSGQRAARAKALVDAKKRKLSEAETDLAMERDKSKNSILEAEASYSSCPVLRRWSMASRPRRSDLDRANDCLPRAYRHRRRDQTQVSLRSGWRTVRVRLKKV